MTPKGRALWEVMTAIRQWGDDWALDADQHPIVLVHDECGHVCRSVPHCSECGEELTLPRDPRGGGPCRSAALPAGAQELTRLPERRS